MGKRSVAWKALEREAARELDGERVSRGDDFSRSDVDVRVKGLPMVKVDAKYRVRHAHHSLMAEVEEKYCDPGDVPVLVTKHHRQRGAHATLPLWFVGVIFKLLRDAHGEQLANTLKESIQARTAQNETVIPEVEEEVH
jgi:hypothetical protein